MKHVDSMEVSWKKHDSLIIKNGDIVGLTISPFVDY
jgi:hypothetical protein